MGARGINPPQKKRKNITETIASRSNAAYMPLVRGELPARHGLRWCGAVAQLGERSNRTAEVRGSTPLGSTISPPLFPELQPSAHAGGTTLRPSLFSGPPMDIARRRTSNGYPPAKTTFSIQVSRTGRSGLSLGICGLGLASPSLVIGSCSGTPAGFIPLAPSPFGAPCHGMPISPMPDC